MQEKGVINTSQFIWMLFIVVTSVTDFRAPDILLRIAGRDAWLATLGGWFMDLLLAFVYAYMGIRFAGQTFVQYSITILGKYLGRIAGFLFPLFFLLTCIVLMSGLGNLINTVLLPRTPLVVILIAGFIVASYVARGGIESIGRVAQTGGVIYLSSGIVLALLLVPYMDLSRLQPQFEKGLRPFLIGSPFVLSFYGICVMMGMFIPICNRPENGFLAKLAAVSMGAFFISTVTSAAIATFGYEQIRAKLNPGLQLSTVVNIGRFWERLEIIWMVIAIGSGLLAAGIMLWAFCLGVSQIVELRNYQPLVYPTALIALTTSVVSFRDAIALSDFMHYTFPIFALSVAGGLELLLLVAALVLRKGWKTG